MYACVLIYIDFFCSCSVSLFKITAKLLSSSFVKLSVAMVLRWAACVCHWSDAAKTAPFVCSLNIEET